jgi:hypothetical protein
MISIIICSRTQAINSDLCENIKDTIGSDYELIVIDNSKNSYSIFEAYNLGIEQSKGEYLCLIHDDICFQTVGWGNIINQILDGNKKIGLIGVAGAKVKTRMPSTWWDNYEGQGVINIIQHHKNKEKEFHNSGFENDQDVRVVVIDGVFMAMRRDSRILFHPKMRGFHTYDLNISFEYMKYGYEIIVTDKILLEHFSSGVINETWIEASYKIHYLYRKELPLFVAGNIVSNAHEIINAQRFINKCLNLGFIKIAIYVWFKLFLLQPISKYNFRFWKILLKNYNVSSSHSIF